MSDLNNAINTINASAAKTENTATFLDELGTYDESSNVTNPNNGQTVPSISRRVNDLVEGKFDAYDDTFQAQFVFKKVGNISDFAGDTLLEADKLNSYQYPDDSDAWYGPLQGQSFPITIPADPSVSDQWVPTNPLSASAISTTEGDSVQSVLDSYGIKSVDKGEYVSGVELATKYDYVTFNGKSYFATNPPHTTTATTPDNDTGNLFVGGYVNQATLSNYTDIVYSSVENMVAGIPVAAKVGDKCSTGGTSWELKTKSSPIVLSDFEPIGCVFVDDFGYTGDDAQVVINTALQSYKHVGLIDGSTHTISQGIELSLDEQCFDYSLATIKWKDNISVASRIETISATNLNDIKIICGLVDGNKDNQSNIPDTPPIGASYGSFIRLNNCLNPSVYNPKAIDLCGYGIMLYGTSQGRFYNTNIINCGNKRAVNYDVLDQTISGEQYSSNNVGDGVYISDGSSSNLFFGFTCGHDTTIQSASSMRAGITFVNGSYNKFYSSTLYNMSRAIHFEPNVSGESCMYNEINGLEIPAIGSMQTCITQYEVDNGQLRFNEISKFECLAQNTLVNGSKKISVFSSLFMDDIQSDYKMKFTDGKFPEWVEVNNGDVLLESVQARGITSRSPGGVQNRLHVIGGIYDNLDLPVGKDVLLDGVGIKLPGNIIGGTSSQDGELKKIEIKNGRYTMPPESTVSFFSRLFAEANLHDNEFLYDGAVDSSGGWIDAYGRVGASDDLFRLASNTFKMTGVGKPSHAIKAISNASVSYVTDGENLVFGSFANGFSVDMNKFFGDAPTKN